MRRAERLSSASAPNSWRSTRAIQAARESLALFFSAFGSKDDLQRADCLTLRPAQRYRVRASAAGKNVPGLVGVVEECCTGGVAADQVHAAQENVRVTVVDVFEMHLSSGEDRRSNVVVQLWRRHRRDKHRYAEPHQRVDAGAL